MCRAHYILETVTTALLFPSAISPQSYGIICTFAVMDIESIRNYCLSLPLATEDTGLGEDYLLFRVCGKIFACYGFAREDYFVLKADPDYAIDLRDRYSGISPAWHWNKKYWNEISLRGSVPEEVMKSLIRHSYAEVVKKLPKHIKIDHPEICEIG